MIGEKEFLRHSRISMDSVQGLYIPHLQFQETVKFPPCRFGFPCIQRKGNQITQLTRGLPGKKRWYLGKVLEVKALTIQGIFFKEVH